MNWPSKAVRAALFAIFVFPNMSGMGGTQPPNTVSPADTITMQMISGPYDLGARNIQISPDGSLVAYEVTQANVQTNDYDSKLYVRSSSGNSGEHLLAEGRDIQGDAFTDIAWSPDGTRVSFLWSKSGTPQVWTVPASGDKGAVQLTHHTSGEQSHRRAYNDMAIPIGIQSYRWAPDGGSLFFSTTDTDETEVQRQNERGILYAGNTGVTNPTPTVDSPGQLWRYTLSSSQEELLWTETRRIPGAPTLSGIASFEVAPDGSAIAATEYSLTKAGGPGSWLVLISLHNGIVRRAAANFQIIQHITWSPDSTTLAFSGIRTVNSRTGRLADRNAIYALSFKTLKARIIVQPHALHREEFNEPQWLKANEIAFNHEEYGDSGIIAFNLSTKNPRRITPVGMSIGSCSLSQNREEWACESETPIMPPEVATFRRYGSGFRVITSLNKTMKSRRLGSVTKLRLVNKYGYGAYVYVIKPVDYIRGKRYPTLVLFDHNDGKYFAHEDGGYPIQAFAAAGFVIIDVPPTYAPEYGTRDYTRSLLHWESPSSTAERAVQKAVSMGITDSSKLGVMGMSWGSELTAFVITHSPIFRGAIAAMGDAPGGINVSTYFHFSELMRALYAGSLGGPPFGPSKAAWLALSPEIHLAGYHGAILGQPQAADLAFSDEFYGIAQHLGVPIEYILFSNDSHGLFQPKHVLYASIINVDWFKFWLMNEIDPARWKHAQYARWQHLREKSPAYYTR